MGKWQTYWKSKGHITKQTVEQYRYRVIDSGDLYDNRVCPFEEGEGSFAFGCRIILFSERAFFSISVDGQNLCHSAAVEATKCNYGGLRHWFHCPNQDCKRRCRKLYMNLDHAFLCRKCLNLAYFTQNRSRLDRIIDKKWGLVHELGANSDFILDSRKPKRMHWKTFDRTRERIQELDCVAMLGIAERFGGFT